MRDLSGVPLDRESAGRSFAVKAERRPLACGPIAPTFSPISPVVPAGRATVRMRHSPVGHFQHLGTRASLSATQQDNESNKRKPNGQMDRITMFQARL